MKVIVVIDPGHYAGYNPWAIRGYNEGTQMWKLANHLKNCLNAWGIDAVLTKNTAASNPGLIARGNVAVELKKSKKYDKVVFISLHDNAPGSTSKDYASIRGTCIFTSMYREKKTASFLKGLQNVVSSVIGCGNKEIYSKAYTEVNKNQDWWGVIRGAMNSATNQTDADLYGADYVLILEHDFHTNPDYCNWMKEDTNMLKVAAAEANYIADFFLYKKKIEPCYGTVEVIYEGSDGVNLRDDCNVTVSKVIGVAYKGTKLTAVAKSNGMYLLSSGLYITAGEKYVNFQNDFKPYVVKCTVTSLNVRNVPEGDVIDRLGMNNLVDCYGTVKHTDYSTWHYVRIKRGDSYRYGYCFSDYLEKV